MNEQQIREFCEANKDKIVVREEVDGLWDRFTLAELPKDKQEQHIKKWIRERRTPHMVV